MIKIKEKKYRIRTEISPVVVISYYGVWWENGKKKTGMIDSVFELDDLNETLAGVESGQIVIEEPMATMLKLYKVIDGSGVPGIMGAGPGPNFKEFRKQVVAMIAEMVTALDGVEWVSSTYMGMGDLAPESKSDATPVDVADVKATDDLQMEVHLALKGAGLI